MFGLETKKEAAIAYYRHSAEDKQENSITIQNDHALKFSDDNNIELIHYESDEGVSGLSSSRPGFERLFDNWITNPDAPDFKYVLVLDETRWGRWQDPDEAAYWTMICKKHGKQVIYMSRGFPRDDQRLLSSLETSIARYMAAEYSRQLGEKVWHGDVKVIEQGFSAGGTAPYGYVRVLLDEQHNRIGILKRGEHKVIANQRVTFEPATDGSEKVVARIFDQFVNHWKSPADIAYDLNEESILSATGSQWNGSMIKRLLSNETYTGTLIWNKTSSRLKAKQSTNPRDMWVRNEAAFEGVISRDIFNKAQERLYWLSPYRWRYGVHKIQRAEKSLHKYVDSLLQDYEPDQRFEILRNLPLTFGLTYHKDGKSRCCFRLNDKLRQHDEVLAIGLNMFEESKPESVFSLPTTSFGVGDFLVVDGSSEHLDGETAKEKILSFCATIAAS